MCRCFESVGWYVHMISYDYIWYVCIVYLHNYIYIYKWILSTPDPPSLRILMQEWYSRQESGEEGWTYLDNCGYSNQKGSSWACISIYHDISFPPQILAKQPGCKRERQAADWRKRLCRRGLEHRWTSHHGMDHDGSENLKVSKLWQHFKILWFESYDSILFVWEGQSLS